MRLATALVLLPSAAIACGTVSVPTPRYVTQAASDLVVIDYPPPPARVEAIPARPAPDAVWIDGEWSARDRKWSWVAGRWVIPPEGAKFSPWAIVRARDGTLYFARGVWRDADGSPIEPPAPLSSAVVESTGAVIDPEGEAEETGATMHRAAPPKP